MTGFTTIHKKVIVIKLGTSSLYDEVAKRFRLANMAQIVEMVIDLRLKGYKVVLVSSGGIAAGMHELGLTERPKDTTKLQALASVGQAHLINLWDTFFKRFGVHFSQVLMTRADIADREQYKNASNLLHELLKLDVVPIINENDTVSTYEVRFGDNDTLSAIAAAMIGAESLFILTDVDCLYTANPRLDPNAEPVRVVEHVSSIKTDDTMSQGSQLGTGGMVTKVIAANLATSAGTTMYVCRSFEPNNVLRILEDVENNIEPKDSKMLYTKFSPHPTLKDREFWLLYGLTTAGSITIDAGAYRALTGKNRANLLPSGIKGIKGHFHASECLVIFVQGSEKPVGRCLTNYSSSELERIKGHHSHSIRKILGYSDTEYISYRDNMAFYADHRDKHELAHRIVKDVASFEAGGSL